MEEISIDKIENEILPEIGNDANNKVAFIEKPLTSTLNAANRAYEDNISLNVRDRISSQVGDATKTVSSVTENLTRRASNGIQELLGINTNSKDEQQVNQLQQGDGMIPLPNMMNPNVGIPQMTINVINERPDNISPPANLSSGKMKSAQDNDGIFNFKNGFSREQPIDGEPIDGEPIDGEQNDGEQNDGEQNSKFINLAK